MRHVLALSLCAVMVLSAAASAGTVAYWRFEDSAPGSNVVTATDYSGNGNTLYTVEVGGDRGYEVLGDVPWSTVPGTGASNGSAIIPTGLNPMLRTDSSQSSPTGVDATTIQPLAWTLEASFKSPAAGSGDRNLIVRAAQGVNTANNNMSRPALYFFVAGNGGVGTRFTDVDGYWYNATSAAGLVERYDATADPTGADSPWYHMAAVSDGATLSVYLAQEGQPFSLAASIDMTTSASTNRALTNGSNGTVTSGDNWTAGDWILNNSMWAGNVNFPTHLGPLDEVRFSDSALSVDEFLAVPEPMTMMLLGLGGLFAARRRRG